LEKNKKKGRPSQPAPQRGPGEPFKLKKVSLGEASSGKGPWKGKRRSAKRKMDGPHLV